MNVKGRRCEFERVKKQKREKKKSERMRERDGMTRPSNN